jgi:hypothetical protein
MMNEHGQPWARWSGSGGGEMYWYIVACALVWVSGPSILPGGQWLRLRMYQYFTPAAHSFNSGNGLQLVCLVDMTLTGDDSS